MAAPGKKIRIGDMCVQEGLITADQLTEALAKQKETGGKLGNILVQLGYTTEDAILKELSLQLNMPYIELDHYNIKQEVIRKIPERVARRFRVLCIDEINEQFVVGMADPTDVVAYDEVSRLLHGNVRIAVVKESDLLMIMDQVYRRTEDIASFAKELKDELGKTETAATEEEEEEEISEDAAPVAKLLDSIFEDAIQVNASDIHIEPDEGCLRIRQRVDGMLQESVIEGKEINAALLLRIKLKAKLNISEKRLPQDGRFHVKVKGRPIDVRVSTMPIRDGEAAVMRLLDQSKGILTLDEVGMREDVKKRIRFLIGRPNGMVLVTGPTGSGKTTTLYSCLAEMNLKEKKIITIEDPVEYTLHRINQVQVNTTIDLTFARVLRSALRADPDIVMVGEMRDEETARIGLRAAMTGHFVLSTLHTNDSISSAVRLVDMGAEGYLVASALRGVMAQRLIRKICENCITDYNPTDEEKEFIEKVTGEYDKNWQFKVGEGCSHCNKTGYAGRRGIHELLEIDSVLADALRENDTKLFANLAVKRPGFKPLTIGAFEIAIEGETTLEEVLRIASEIEDVRKHKVQGEEAMDISKISF